MNARSLALGSAGVVFAAVVHVGAQAPSGRVPSGGAAAAAHTYARDVAPIMQRSCQTCHRPGTNAPMSLLTYEDVRPWARAIKAKVTARLMPPWHIERNVGIQQFKDDPSLSDAEIATIASWVDAGAPRGNDGDLPPKPTFPDDEAWTIGEPDLIVEIPKPHVVPAAGPDLWIDYIADSGMTEDRYLKAVEAKPGPGARAVVHHLLTYLIQDIDEGEVLAGRLDDRPTNNESFLNEFAVGKNGDILPDGTAKLVKAGSKIRFNLHYHASGTATTDRARVGLKFYPKGYKPKYHQISLQIANAHEELDIPPNSWTRHDGYYRFSRPARVTAVQAHMHNRGKRMCVEAILPTGPRRDAQLHVLRLQLAQGLQLRRRGDANPAGRDDAAHDPVARQHRQQPQQSRSAQLGRLRPAHDRRDGVLLGDVDLSRRRGLQDPARRAEQEPDLGARAVAPACVAVRPLSVSLSACRSAPRRSPRSRPVRPGHPARPAHRDQPVPPTSTPTRSATPAGRASSRCSRAGHATRMAPSRCGSAT